jgi:tyrosyl-tRNA synthetase
VPPDLLDELQQRGLIHDATDREALAARLAEGPITLYYGCDPTADSLHIGNLIGLVVLKRFQDAGHRPIALAGGATGMIGDPSGRSSERNLLDDDTLSANVAAIKAQIGAVLGDEGEWQLVDNLAWTRDVPLLDFLRDVGKHFTVNQMVAKESVKARMQSEDGISYTEFSYMLLQANDYLVLHGRERCQLQIGGSDQWGNITAGIELIRRRTGEHAHGLTWPLIARSDGRKFGKSEEGNVWLGAERTSPYRFYQYWMNVPDADVGRFLKLFTFLDLEAIAQLDAETAAAPERRIGQRALAFEVTALVHGSEQAEAAREASEVLFGGDPGRLSPAALETLAGEVPTVSLPVGAQTVLDLVVEAGLVKSRGDGRRQLAQGAVYVNNARLAEDRPIGESDLLHGRWILLRRGQREYALAVAAVG